jgi:hypothetical protein
MGGILDGVKTFAENALIQLAAAHDAIIAARVQQTENTNKRRQQEPSWGKGELVYLATKNLNLPKNRARKLCPKFIGPYRIAEAHPDTSNYTLELPPALKVRRIHPQFHASVLRPYRPSSDEAFPSQSHMILALTMDKNGLWMRLSATKEMTRRESNSMYAGALAIRHGKLRRIAES